MERKTIFKIMAAAFVPLLIYVIYNWQMISTGLYTINVYTMIIIITGIMLLPFGWFLGLFIQAWVLQKAGHKLLPTTKTKALDPIKREENARMFVNRQRMTDHVMRATSGMEMEMIRSYLSSSREDTVQWDLYAFVSSEDVPPNWNPRFGVENVPAEKIFYVVENAMTGECSLDFFDNWEEAKKELDRKWSSGITRDRTTELEKNVLNSMVQGFGAKKGAAAAESQEKNKNKEESNE